MRNTSGQHRLPARGGFTLIELMISVAFVLVLMIAVNFIFSVSSKTVSAGQKLSELTRIQRAAMATMEDDFRNFSKDLLVITSTVNYRPGGLGIFSNKNDELGNGGNAADRRDLDGNGTFGEAGVPGEQVKLAIYDSRNSRIDRIMFTRLGLARRQTADGEQFTSPTTSNESYVYYGPLGLNDSNRVYDPSSYLIDQSLGRRQVLLREAVGESAYQRVLPPPSGFHGLPPLSWNCAAGTEHFQNSRFDLAQSSITLLKQDMKSFESAGLQWWKGLVYYPDTNGNWNIPWYPRYRNSLSAPIKGSDMALLSPLFVPNCSQFIVEFAGDYLQQGADGNVTGTGADGILDFVIVHHDKTTGRFTRSVRWYGLPRDTYMGGAAGIPGAIDTAGNPRPAEYIHDVVPLADLRASHGEGPAPFEKERPWKNGVPPTLASNYVTDLGFADAGLYRYTCVFTKADEMPWMLRIVMKLEDQAGNVVDGQWCEYTFKLR